MKGQFNPLDVKFELHALHSWGMWSSLEIPQ